MKSIYLLLSIIISSAQGATHTITVSGANTIDPYYTFSGLPTNFIKGDTYTFQGSSISSSHPFSVGTAYETQGVLDAGTGYSASNGITGDASFEITIPSSFTGNQIMYFCTSHSSMNKYFGNPVVASTTGKCSGNTDNSEDVTCTTGTLKTNSHTISRGSDPQGNCCESASITGKCSGNSDSSEDVTCGTGTIFKDNPQDITKGSDSQGNCCESGYSFGLADINLCPDDSAVNIAWAGKHNIQESDGYGCTTDLKSGSDPLTFTGSTTLDGDGGFLVAGSRRPIEASLLSDWNTVRYFRCTKHCSGARLRVTCDRANPSASSSSSSSPAPAPQQCEAPFNRDDYDSSKGNCHDTNCDGSSKCVDTTNKVTSVCQCSPCGDIRVVMAALDEYCDENGRWSPKDSTLDGMYSSDTDRADKIKANNLDYGFVEAVTGKNNIKYKCTSTCRNARSTESNAQRRLARSNLRIGLKASSTASYNKFGSDTCKSADCALCTKCKIEASEKRFGFVPLVHTFVDSKGNPKHQGGCSDVCDDKFEGSTYEFINAKRSLDIKVVEGMQSRTAAETAAAQGAGYDAGDAAGISYGGTKGNFYSVDGQISRTIFAVVGGTYTFNTDSSLSSHPLAFRKLSDASAHSSTSSGNTVTVSMPAAGQHLEYYCTNHTGMGGIIKVFSSDMIKELMTCDSGECSSCKVCNDLYGTDDIDANTTPDPSGADTTKPVDMFVPHAPDEDVHGDGSRISGGCKSWCEKNYREIGQIWPIFRNKLDSDSYGASEQYADRTEARENNVCGWLRCSGCPMCLKASAGTTNDFFHQESTADYTGSKYEITKDARLGGCQVREKGAKNCKTIWTGLNTDSERNLYCTERDAHNVDCTGCPVCKKYTTEKYDSSATNSDYYKGAGSRTAAGKTKKAIRDADTVSNFASREHRSSGVVRRKCPPQLFCEMGISKYYEICANCYVPTDN